MKMKFLVILILFLTFIGCVTIEKTSESELIITRRDSDDYLKTYINIDGGNRIRIKPGERKVYKISNGYHIINFKRPEWNGTKEYAGFIEGTGLISFECENERVEIVFRAMQINHFNDYNMVKKTSLIQQNLQTPSKDIAINKTYNTLKLLIPDGATIAIMDIIPSNADSNFIQEELTVLFVNSKKYKIVDRQTLNTVRIEQHFQTLGEVSDETAVSLGQFLGADVVITGNISGAIPNRRLRLRAIDVKTAQIIAMSSEDI